MPLRLAKGGRNLHTSITLQYRKGGVPGEGEGNLAEREEMCYKSLPRQVGKTPKYKGKRFFQRDGRSQREGGKRMVKKYLQHRDKLRREKTGGKKQCAGKSVGARNQSWECNVCTAKSEEQYTRRGRIQY